MAKWFGDNLGSGSAAGKKQIQADVKKNMAQQKVRAQKAREARKSKGGKK